jgi:hypothetical protein
VHRFFNTVTTGHFFTISESEKELVIENYPQFRYEGTGFYAYPMQVAGALPVHRFFNAVTTGHFFTISESEKELVIENYPQFRYEGTGFYAYTPPPVMPEPVSDLTPAMWSGNYLSFNVSADGTNLTTAGSQLEGGHSWILDIPLSGNGCGYPSATVFSDSIIPIERKGFNVSGITSSGAAINISGYFDSATSAQGSYAYSNGSNGCYGNGLWTASPH